MAAAQPMRPLAATGIITDEDLIRLPKDGRKWELVAGKLQEAPTSAKHAQIVVWIGFLMSPYAEKFEAVSSQSVPSGSLPLTRL